MLRRQKKLNARLQLGQALDARLGKQRAKRQQKRSEAGAARKFLLSLFMPLFKLAFILAVSGALLLGAYAGLAHSSWFSLKHVQINGATHLSRLDILSAAGLGLHTNLINLKPMEVEAGISELPWIQQVSVERILPNKVLINVVEQAPYAIGLIEGQLFLLNQSLKPFAPFIPARNQELASLPVVSGLSRAEFIQEDEELEELLNYGKSILTITGQNSLLGALSQIDLNRISGIKLVFEHVPATIKIGDDFSKEKFEALVKVASDLKQRGELRRAVLIDLTLDKSVTVRLGQDKV